MSGAPILIVDDNPANLKLLSFILSSQGYDLRTAADANEALAILEAFHPKLILLDLQLPGIDGLELTRQLKANPEMRHVPIVAVTAYAMKGDEQKALRAGCDSYLTKPIDKDRLRQVVAEYVGRTTATV